MIITKLMGGLGNQMFQYAFGKYLSIKHQSILKVDTQVLLDRTPHKKFFVFRDYELDIFNLEVVVASREEVNNFTKKNNFPLPDKIMHRLVGVKSNHIIEPHFHFSQKSFEADDNSYVDGYWQSEKYFSSIREELKKNDFSFRNPIGTLSEDLARQIFNSNAVCVNVRRGDFLVTSLHGTCSPEYFKQGEAIIAGKISNPHFFVFSDDIEWCIQNLSFDNPVTYVGHEHAGNKFQDKFRLMAACKHFIIPNSTFAWWAAWLNNNNQKIVIAPKKWFASDKLNTKDILPPGWIAV
jgi:hypothetical protein